MIESIRKVFQNYATFTGRANRPEYWWFFLFSMLVSIGLSIVEVSTGVKYISSLWSLAVLLPSIAVGVRRMHDVGKSGWFLLIPIYSLILLCTEGDNGANDYGPDPNNPHGTFDFENSELQA